MRSKISSFPLIAVAVLLAAAAGFACGSPPPGGGGGGGGNGGNGGNGGGGDNEIADMDENDVDDLCDDLLAHGEANQDVVEDGSCKLEATFAAPGADDPVAACDDAYNNCLAEEYDAEEEFECEPRERHHQACEATGDDYFDCVNERIDAMETISNEFSCEEIEEEESDELADAFETALEGGAACDAFYNTCPEDGPAIDPNGANNGNGTVNADDENQDDGNDAENQDNDGLNNLPNSDDNQDDNQDANQDDNQQDNQDDNQDNGLTGNTEISDMSDAEVMQMCDEVDASWDQLSNAEIENRWCSLLDAIEGLQATQQGGDANQACQDAVCDIDASQVPTFCMVAGLESFERNNCHATYDEYLACEDEMFDGLADFEPFTCSDMNSDGSIDDMTLQAALMDAAGQGNACQVVLDKCPPLAQ